MTQTPAQLDGRFALAGAGREYTFGQLLKIALRQFWRNKWPALGVGLVVGLISVATRVGLVLAARPIREMAVHLASGPAISALLVALVSVSTFLQTLLMVPLKAGYQWAVICSFPQHRMLWRDVFQPWKKPWRRPILLYALALAIAMGSFTAAYSAWGYFVFSWSALGPSMGWRSVAGQVLQVAGTIAAWVLLLLATLLVTPVILSTSRPRLRRAFTEHFRIVRGQTRRVLAVVGIWVGLEVAVVALYALAWRLIPVSILFQWMGPPGTLGYYCFLATVYAIPCLLRLIPLAVSLHLVAVIFRSAYGLPLEPMAPHDGRVENLAEAEH